MVDIHLPAPGSIVRHRHTGNRYLVTEHGVVSVDTGAAYPNFHLADYLDTYDVLHEAEEGQ